MRLKISCALSAAVAASLWLAACRSYERDPLNLDVHRKLWRDRAADSEQVLAFARRLDEVGRLTERFDPTNGISVREAEVVALVFNPDLRVARARADVVAATAANAGLWEDPVFQIDVLHITESVSKPWIITPGIALTIPLSGRLEAEHARANAALRGQLFSIAEAEWAVRGQVRQTWAKWSATQLRIEVTEALLARLRSLVDSTEQLAELGELVRTETALFKIEEARQRISLVRLRGEIAQHQQRLRSLLGLAPAAPVEFVANLAAEIESTATEAVLAEGNPTLARLRAEYEAAEQTLRREILKQYPDLTLGSLYESDERQSRVGFLGAIPLPILNANRQGIAEAKAQRALARAAFETEYERMIGDLAAAGARLEALRQQRGNLEETLIPLVDEQVADAAELLQLGESGALVLLESQARVFETKIDLVELRLSEALATIEINQLIGFQSYFSATRRGNEVTQ